MRKPHAFRLRCRSREPLHVFTCLDHNGCNNVFKREKQHVGLAGSRINLIPAAHHTLFHQMKFNFHCMQYFSLQWKALRSSSPTKQRQKSSKPSKNFCPCPDKSLTRRSETSSQEEERLRQEQEYEQALQDREAEEEDQDEDYWRQYNEQLI